MNQLYESVSYRGQEKALRRLLLIDGYSTTDVATMTLEEVCEEVSKKYSVLSAGDEEILLVKHEDKDRIEGMIERICR